MPFFGNQSYWWFLGINHLTLDWLVQSRPRIFISHIGQQNLLDMIIMLELFRIWSGNLSANWMTLSIGLIIPSWISNPKNLTWVWNFLTLDSKMTNPLSLIVLRNEIKFLNVFKLSVIYIYSFNQPTVIQVFSYLYCKFYTQ